MPQGTSAPNLHRADVSKAASRPLAHRSCRTLGQLRNDQNLSSSRTVIATTFRILFASGTLLWASSTLATPVTPRMSSADWDSEFSALLAGLSQNYANFEDTVRIRKVDLATSEARGRTAIRASNDDQARKEAFNQFIKTLGDPHLFIDWSQEDGRIGELACPTSLASIGARPGVGFDRLPDFLPLDSEDGRTFQAGLLRLNSSLRVGVIRISLFMARAFSSACAAAVRDAGFRPDAPCSDSCIDQIEGRAGRILDDGLVSTVRELERAGATELLIDVTHNDGGTDWSEVVARVLAGSVRSARIGMLKHPVWRQFLDERLSMLRNEVRKARGQARVQYENAIEATKAARSSLDESCDLSGAWRLADAKALPSCTTIVEGDVYATGAFNKDEEVPAQVVPELYSPALYAPYPLHVTHLPLFVLIDGNTHSAAEQFAALLQDNGRATIIGSVSAGAGCGTFTTLGSSFKLPHSLAQVHVPDCVRFRADGSNERRGVVPDQVIPWGPSDSRYEIANKIAVTMGQRH